MDDTTQSRAWDAAASAAETRKRRSSILKSQRAPRTPFCELEFNVLTPTDTSKSRRVSFSKRTGVAEFATNEATTTWKNFYEEHNKSLESSGNDSEMHHGKQSIGHIGKRVFDQQFEEMEAVDFMGTLNPGTNTSSSINHINFAQLECTEPKLSAPQNNFELSALTETQSKLFGDNLAITSAGEASIQINEEDDLDEIQKDLQRNSNVVCQGPFTGRDLSEYIEVDLNMTHVAIANDESNMSITDTISSPKVQEISKSNSIEKKIGKDWVIDKENIILNPYIASRESVNFVATEMPDEVLVFDGKRLIVETEIAKKEIYRQSVLPDPSELVPKRKTIVLNCNDDLPNFLDEAQLSRNKSGFGGIPEVEQSYTLDDKLMHNRLDDTQNKYKTIMFGDDLDDISVTQALPNIITDVGKRHTIIYDDEVENISVTQALPSNIMDKESRTIAYEKDISITQTVPAAVIPNDNNEKRRTIVFENESCDISVTQAIPTNIVSENIQRQMIVREDITVNTSASQSILNIKKGSEELRQTMVYEDNTEKNLGTHFLTSTCSTAVNALAPRRTTVVFESDTANISVTQALPSNIILNTYLIPQKLNTTTYENDGNISMTQAIPTNILLGNNNEPNRKKSVLNDTGNLSITEVLTKNQIIQDFAHQQCLKTEQDNNDAPFDRKLHEDILNSQTPSLNQVSVQEQLSNLSENITGNKRRTVVFENDAADISITQAVPIRQVIVNIHNQNQEYIDVEAVHEVLLKESSENKRRTVVFEHEDANVSLTQAVPMNRVIDSVNEMMQQKEYNNSLAIAFRELGPITNKNINIAAEIIQENSIQASNKVLYKEEATNKRRTVVFENDDADISMTRANTINKVINAIQKENLNVEPNAILDQELANKRRTIVFENDDADISMTQMVPMNKVIDAVMSCQRLNNKRKTVVFKNDDSDISMTQAVSMNKLTDTLQKENQNIECNVALDQELTNKRRTVVFDNDDADISMTQAVPMNKVIDAIQKENVNIETTNVSLRQEFDNKRKTVVFENDDADISMTNTVPMNKIIETAQKEKHGFEEKPLHKDELTNERRIAAFENYDPDICMSRADAMNQVLDTTQNNDYSVKDTNVALCKEDITTKRKSAVSENYDANISMTQAVPMNHVVGIIKKENQNIVTDAALHQGLNYKKHSDVFENDGTDISASNAVTKTIHRQKDESKHNTIKNEYEANKNETIHFGDAMNEKTSQIIYDDDEGDISMTQAVSSSIILPDGQEKKRTIVVESVESLLENKDLFIEIDRLTDSATVNKSDLKDLEKEDDVSMSDFSDMEICKKEAIEYNRNDVRVKKSICDNFSSNIQDKSYNINIEGHTALLSKPIPATLASFQHDIVDNSLCKELSKLGGSLLNATKEYTDLIVYQSTTSNAQDSQTRIDKEDYRVHNAEEKAVPEDKKDSSQSLAINTEVEIPKPEQLNSQNEFNVKFAEESSSKCSTVKTDGSKPNNSILNELLKMSESSLEGTEDKDLMAEIKFSLANVVQTGENNSIDAMFYITRDSEEDGQINQSGETSGTQLTTQEMRQIQNKPPLSIEFKKDEDPPNVKDLQTKLSTIKHALIENHTSEFKPSRQDKHNEYKGSKVSKDMSKRKSSKGFKMANDTNELLEMLSDFTDTRYFPSLGEVKERKHIPESLLSLERKIESSKQESSKQEPSGFNRNLKRLSVALSREDLLNNLSMASAMLQKSRSDSEESDSIEKTPEVSKEQRKSVKLNTDVVKTLQFDDSISGKSESIQTPLKKTAFGEISYMKEPKCNVIPNYFNNVSDGIKELMDDLVKPTSDTQPFNKPFDKYMLKRNASTCSTQIQANLLTSSQIDLDTDLYSITNSVSDMKKISSADMITDATRAPVPKALRIPYQSTSTFTQSEKSSDMDVTSDDTDNRSVATTVPQTKPISGSQFGHVLIFDQHNPLNNVLLVPPPAHAIDIHRYDPIKPKEQLELQFDKIDMEHQEKSVINQYRVEISTATAATKYEDTAKADKSVTSIESKPVSIDRCTEPDPGNVRDMEINTVIVMKGNEELLQASSSLTLVDDETARDHRSPTSTYLRDTASSPVKVIYTTEEPHTKKDLELIATTKLPSKSKKRIYSPEKRENHKHCTLSSLDVTPKPATKMQKRSVTDYEEPNKLPAENNTPEPEKQEKSPTLQKTIKKIRSEKPGTTITVQQLMTMVHVEPNRWTDVEVAERTESSTTEPRSASGSRDVLGVASSSMTSSFASSNNLRDASSLLRCAARAPPAPATSLLDDMHAGDDVVAAIDAMPFMGSGECEWESAAGPEWSLLLLHARLRLSVRFAEPRVRADTAVLRVHLERLHQDKKNPIAYLCVIFAAEMMRYYMSRGCGAARDVCKLVRRLGGAARLAARWARAMHDARARLAYSLTHDGCLALKVANTSYRSVWEVTMRLELVVEDARAAPWPRACGVRVARVVAPSGAARAPDVQRALAATPHDWGHAPRTIWKVFRYLKHKKRDDDVLRL